jgi:hypothetical protein
MEKFQITKKGFRPELYACRVALHLDTEKNWCISVIQRFSFCLFNYLPHLMPHLLKYIFFIYNHCCFFQFLLFFAFNGVLCSQVLHKLRSFESRTCTIFWLILLSCVPLVFIFFCFFILLVFITIIASGKNIQVVSLYMLKGIII